MAPTGTSGSAEESEFVSTREAAKILGVALRTVQLWVEHGDLIAWKTAGGHRRIARGSVDAMVRQQQQALQSSAPKRRLDVLVVEDDEDLLKLYELNFESWELPVRLALARNGFEGLRMLGEVKPDVLITDLNMPGIDGFRMLRTISSWPGFSAMLTIAVSALSSGDIADRGGLPDGVLLFTKPAPFSKIEALIRERVTSQVKERGRNPARADPGKG